MCLSFYLQIDRKGCLRRSSPPSLSPCVCLTNCKNTTTITITINTITPIVTNSNLHLPDILQSVYHTMKEEISAAVLFLSKLVSGNANLSEEMVAKFERRLGELLQERFSNHWHPERPWQGQGYRCLRYIGLKKHSVISCCGSIRRSLCMDFYI